MMAYLDPDKYVAALAKPATLFLVGIKDKNVRGEPWVRFAVVQAGSLEDAVRIGNEAGITLAGPKGGRMVGEAEPLEIGRWHRTTRMIGHVMEEEEPAPRPRCPGCGYEIDPDVCWCGDEKKDHGRIIDHLFWPANCHCQMGKAKRCDCGHLMLRHVGYPEVLARLKARNADSNGMGCTACLDCNYLP